MALQAVSKCPRRRSVGILKNEDNIICSYSVSLGDALTMVATWPFFLGEVWNTHEEVEVIHNRLLFEFCV